ncbi:MAG: MinD/ParA family protein [Anaeromyxobacter sp.]|nr:MinD/ParA family protein [Anaeromyxobacter sp.]MBL0276170.1 MinD/ParA family protein [Anaeromyxobacter sp.]
MVDQAASLRDLVGQPRAPRPPLRVIAVTSGKGGVGKTHVSANLAVLCAKAGRRVLLIDADLGLANADIVLGICPTRHLGHLLDGSATATEVLTEGPHGVRVLGASSGVQELTQLTDEQKLRLVSAFEEAESQFDLVLLDCGAGIGDNVLFFAGAAQEALLVVSPEPTSLSDAYATVKVLSQQAGVASFAVVANQAADFQGRDVFRRLTQVTERFLPAKLTYLGHVPRDENLQRAVQVQQPVVDLYPRSPASRALQVLADALLASPAPAALQGGVKLFWQQLLEERAPGA